MTDNQEEKEPQSHADKYKGEALNAYRAFDAALKIKAGDNFLVKISKVTGRVLGISFFILLSPFVMLGLFFALIAAG
jgi:hypothetical protein